MYTVYTSHYADRKEMKRIITMKHVGHLSGFMRSWCASNFESRSIDRGDN